MKFFVDTADLEEIRDLAEAGALDGVTTNPTLVYKAGSGDFFETIREICEIVPGPVSAETTALDFETMLAEGRKVAKIADNIAVKVPTTVDGLKCCRALRSEGTMVNVTLCFSAAQALLAAKAGASFVSPFIGRHDDIAQDGMQLIADIRQIFDNYDDLTTEILVASVRDPVHVVDAARIGADVCTVPPGVLRKLFKHPLTDRGIESFLADWEKTGLKIL